MSQLEDDLEYLSNNLPDDYVDLDSDQSISGQKTFEQPIKLSRVGSSNVDTISNTTDGISIDSSNGNNLLNINETLESVSAFNKPLAFTEEVSDLIDNAKSELNTSVNTKLLDYVAKTDIVNNLTSTDTNKPLSANQGKILDEKISSMMNDISNISVPTKTSELTNDGDGNSPFATQQYVEQNGGKIDAIKVDGVTQSIVNKEVDIQLASRFNAKLDKVSTTGATKVYGIDTNGSQVMYDVSQTATGTNIVRRNNGQITVPNLPTSQTDATSKEYVDNAVASISGQNEYIGSYNGTTYTTSTIQSELTSFVQSLESRSPRQGDLVNIVNAGNGVDYSGQQWIYDGNSQTWKYYITFETHDVINNLTSTSTNDGLSANQGRVLKGMIDDLQSEISTVGGRVDGINVPTKTSDLTNDGSDGTNPFITSNVNDLVNYYTDDEIDTMLDEYILKSSINNTLTVTTSGSVLDARQGKVLNDAISQTNSSLSTTNQNLSSLTTRVETAESTISSQGTQISVNTSSISTLNSSVSSLSSNLSSLTSRVDTNETNISTIQNTYFPLSGNKTITGAIYLSEGVSLRAYGSGSTGSHYNLLSNAGGTYTNVGNTSFDLWLAGSNTRPMYSTLENGSQVNRRLALQKDVTDHNSSSTAHSDIRTLISNVEAEIPTLTSELTNDSGFITNTVNNLTNYYTKTQTYTKSEVESLVNSITSFSAQIVTTLPSSGSPSVIYLVPKTTSGTQNAYDEYMWINNAWENIGATTIDLSNYYNKSQTYSRTEVNGFLNAKANQSSLDTTNASITNLTSRVSTLETNIQNISFTALKNNPITVTENTSSFSTNIVKFTNNAFLITTANGQSSIQYDSNGGLYLYSASGIKIANDTTMQANVDFTNSSSWLTPYLLAFKNANTSQSVTYPYTGFYQWGDEWQVNARDSSNAFAHNILSINLVSKVANFSAIPTVNGSNIAMSSDLGTQCTFSLSGTTLTITPK